MTAKCTIPTSLNKMQQWFAGVITQPLLEGERLQPLAPSGEPIEREARVFVSPSQTLKPEERMEIYAQQYWWRLQKILQKAYPLLTTLLGKTGFNRDIATPYLLRYPSTCWFIDFVGNDLINWMEEELEIENKPFLLDAARVDFAFQRGFFIEEHPPIKCINDKEVAELFTRTLYLQPHIQLLKMPYDLFSYRQELMKKEPEYWLDHTFPKLLEEKTYYFIVFRRSHDQQMLWKESVEAEFLLLSQFEQSGNQLQNICEWIQQQGSTLVEETKEHFTYWVHHWLEDGWLYAK